MELLKEEITALRAGPQGATSTPLSSELVQELKSVKEELMQREIQYESMKLQLAEAQQKLQGEPTLLSNFQSRYVESVSPFTGSKEEFSKLQ